MSGGERSGSRLAIRSEGGWFARNPTCTARIALVGDRGMLTTARIRADLQPAGLDWISALTTKHLRKLVAAPGQAGQGQKSQAPLAADSLVPDAVAEITSPDCRARSPASGSCSA